MKRITFFALLLLACNLANATEKMTPKSMSVIGEWAGSGSTAGQNFTACAKFSPHMDDVYLRMEYDVYYGKSSKLPDQKSETFYVFLDAGRVEGVSLDSLSNVFQITGIFANQRMSVHWLKNGKNIGKAEWFLSSDRKMLTFVRYGRIGEEYREIGDVVLRRLPAGKTCGK